MKGIKNPEFSDEQNQDLDVFNALSKLQKTDGGKILTENLLNDIVRSIGILESQYKTLSHIELVANCAALSEKLAIMRVITHANQNFDDLKALLSDTLQN